MTLKDIKSDSYLWIKAMIFIIIISYIGFLAIEFLNLHIYSKISTYLKYLTIILCYIISIFIGEDGYDRRDRGLLQLARFLTVVSDYFLLIATNIKAGVVVFIFVQIVYIIRHNRMRSKYLDSLVFLVITAITLGLMSLVSDLSRVTSINRNILFLGFIYGSILCTSVFVSIRTLERSKYNPITEIFIALGMILFLLCDVSVAIYNITENMPYERVQNIVHIAIWFFYLPSQLLLTLSGFKSLPKFKILFK